MSKLKNDKRICGETIFEHRVGWGMSQKALGEKLGINIMLINKIENDPDYLASQRVALILANEIINNPPVLNREVVELMAQWEKKQEDA